MPKTTTDIGDNSSNNQVYQGNTFNISLNSNEDKKSKKRLIIALTIVVVIATIAIVKDVKSQKGLIITLTIVAVITTITIVLLLFFHFNKPENVDTEDKVRTVQNTLQSKSCTYFQSEIIKKLSKEEIIDLYKKAKIAYKDWLPYTTKYVSRKDWLAINKKTFYKVNHDNIKNISDLENYLSLFFVKDVYKNKINKYYADISGMLFESSDAINLCCISKSNISLSKFVIEQIDNNKIELKFQYIHKSTKEIETHIVTLLFQDNKWLFTDDFMPFVDLDDPIITDNLNLEIINNFEVLLYNEKKLGQVVGNDGLGIKVSSTPDFYNPIIIYSMKDEKPIICEINEGTILNVLGYYKYNPNYIYVNYEGYLGFIPMCIDNKKCFIYN